MLPLKNLLRRKVRTSFALLQIAVAIATYVSIVGVTQGLRAQFYRISRVFAYDLIIQPAGAASPVFSVVSREEASQLGEVAGVASTSLLGIHFMRHPHIDQPLGLMAMDPGSELISRYQIVRGRPLKPDDREEILVGELMAKDMGLDTSALLPGRLQGEPPEILFEGGHSFRVVGIYTPPMEGVAFLSGHAIMPLRHYEERYRLQPRLAVAHLALGRRTVDSDEVRRALTLAAEVSPRIEAALPRLQARTIEAFLDSFKHAQLIDGFALAISLLAALVSGIGVANTMLMSVFDRTREIGLLRSIGWSRWRIVAMVEAEGFILSLCGGLLGLPLGALLIQAASQLVQMGWLKVAIDPLLYGKAVAVAVFIGFLGTLYPALRAAGLQPTEALRYE